MIDHVTNRVPREPKPLVRTADAGGTANPSVDFWVRSPDTRIRMKLSVYHVPDPGVAKAADLRLEVNRLLLRSAERTPRGELFVTNIVFDQATPTQGLQIPEQTGLDGFAIEFRSATEWVRGVFTALGPSVAGFWFADVEWMKDDVFSPKEWDEYQRRMELLVPHPGRLNFLG